MRLLSICLRWTAALLFGLGCFAVAYYAFTFFSREINLNNPFTARFVVSGWDVPGHIFGAGLALLLAPLQLLSGVRRRWPRLHRLGGGVYAGSILIAAVSALSLAPHAQGGWASGSAFVLLALLWVGFTATGIGYAIRRDFANHRRWMIRSVALTASAVTLRLILGVGAGALHLPMLPVYITAAWACWTVNLALAELILRWPAIRARRAARRGFSTVLARG
ncbi:DUF2306 domain-containing protein [Pseudomonas sp. CGJS7]|uniref:DUF2306 domain-containing protein n=1 Tax=Pseudomonas sp. CGJS7 TaxID=3109348 RepID=UPI00300A2CD4